MAAPAVLAALALALRRSTRTVALAAAGGSAVSVAITARLAAGGFRGPAVLHEWAPELLVTVAWRIETVTLALALLAASIGLLVAQYSAAYFGDSQQARRAIVTLALFQSSMLGLVLADNLYLLFVFWELTGLTSFFLISLDRTKPDSLAAAQRALLVTSAGALPMLVGIIYLAARTGTASLTTLSSLDLDPRVATVALALFLPAIVTKSAQVPFHSWLPGAMAAPTPVSAYLHSATMVKAGIILLLFLYPILAVSGLWMIVLVPIGAATCVWGSYRALGEDDVKLLLAWSTVSQLGLLTLTIGLGTDVAVRAALLHLFAHAVFKAGLFLTVGGIDRATGTRSLRHLGGLWRRSPVLFVAAAVLAASMAGIPPLAGFLSKELILKKVLATDWWIHGIAIFAIVAGSVGTVAYSSRFVFEVFTGAPRSARVERATRLGSAWLAAPVLLAVVTLAAGPGAAWVDRWFLEPVTASVVGKALDDIVPLSLWYGLNAALLLSIVIVSVGYLCDRVAGLRMLPHGRFFQAGERLFDSFLEASQRLGRMLSRLLAGARPGVYYALAIAFGLAAAVPVAIAARFPELDSMPATGLVAVVLLAAVLATLLVAKNRLAKVLLLSAAGFAVAFLYRLMNAPDLMLTQLLVEVLVTIFFALVLRRMPPLLDVPRAGRLSRWGRPLLATGAGVLAGSLVLAFGQTRASSHVRDFYLEAAPEVAKGLNAVNVILTDFRALDTLMETLVVALAALGAAGLLRAIERDPAGGPERAVSTASTRSRGLLPGMARLIVPVAAIFSLSLLLKGHDEPGGGFVAGLALGVAAVLAYAAFGRTRLHAAGQTAALVGLSVMLATGLAALFFGRPTLTHAYGEVFLGIGSVKWHSALLFDLGVVLTVSGGVASAAGLLWRPLARGGVGGRS